MRKTHANSILLSQPPGVRAAIYALETEEGLTLEAIRARLAAPLSKGGFELEASVTTISEFLRRMRTEAFRSRIQAAATTAAEVEDVLDEDDARRIDGAILSGLREWILDTVSNREITAKDAKALIGLILKDRAQSVDERKLALLEKKAEAFDKAAETAADDNLTPAERLERIRKGLQV